jgi:uncharacterized membrane protein YgdD (TMEM256/DUF423 family)
VNRHWGMVAAVSAGLAVTAGAFGAHALKAQVGPEALAVWETAVRYQLVHALALLALAQAAQVWPPRPVRIAGLLWVIGTVLFSGSLYALVLSGVRTLGWVTPFGGAALIAGWAALAWAAWRAR